MVSILFFDEIDVRLDDPQEVEHFRGEFVDPPRQRPGELLARHLLLEIAPGMNEIGDRLRLDEIELSVEKRAPGELAGRRGAGAFFEQRFEDPRHEERAPVATDLNGVFAGIRLGTPRDGAHHFVDDFGAASADEAVVDAPVLPGSRMRRPAHRAVDRRKNPEGLGAREPYHGDTRLPRGRRERRDGVIIRVRHVRKIPAVDG